MDTDTVRDEGYTTIRARVWSGCGVQKVEVWVYGDSVLAWDPIAGYYTLCHSLSASACRRARRKVAALRGERHAGRAGRSPADDYQETLHGEKR